MQLTIPEAHLIAGALRIAIDQYASDAVTARNAGLERIACQFDSQRREAERLADQIENTDID